jgi:hypothetical protein
MVFSRPAHGAEWTAHSAPEFDCLFQRTNGWIGADGNFAVMLTNSLTLWLFSDTFIGTVQNGRRTNATMINNSAAWQHGTDPKSARVEFYYGLSADGRPASLIKPDDGKGWFWLFDGALVRGKLFLFLNQVESTGEKSAFGFRQIGTWLGEVSNPFAPPTQWSVKQTKIPFAKFSAGDERSFGSALLMTHEFGYIYGIHSQRGEKAMILARVPTTRLADFSAWQFRTTDGWSTNFAAGADLCLQVANEYSVSWLPAPKQFVLVCSKNGLSEKIITRTANDPWGPWSAPTVAFDCPESKWGSETFCYSAKAHPMLAQADNELIVTYAANAFDFTQVMNDARLYWPRFVRLSLK